MSWNLAQVKCLRIYARGHLLKLHCCCCCCCRCRWHRLAMEASRSGSKPSVLTLLTSKYASRHNGAHFFVMSTSKTAPKLRCFVPFHFQSCFLPQGRALFRHLNVQKCLEPNVLWRFWLANLLRAAAACTFSTSQLPKMLRTRPVLTLFASKCASRHNRVQLFISHPASWLRTRPLARTFPQCFTTFLPFCAPASSLFWLSPSLSFSISYLLLSDFLHGWPSSWLCFSICPYCRKFSFQTSFENPIQIPLSIKSSKSYWNPIKFPKHQINHRLTIAFLHSLEALEPPEAPALLHGTPPALQLQKLTPLDLKGLELIWFDVAKMVLKHQQIVFMSWLIW